MPLRDLDCRNCGVHEVLVKYEDPDVCPECGLPAQRLVSMPARTSNSWGESNARFDKGLGMTIRSAQHRDQVLKAKGLVPLSDVGGDTRLDEYMHAKVTPPEDVKPDLNSARKLIQRAQAARSTP